MHTFKMERKYLNIVRWSSYACILCLVYGFALPFLLDEDPDEMRTVTLSLTVIFGSLIVILWIGLRRMARADVAADDAGIWYMHIGRERGLIPWEEIYQVKESPYRQCLYLIDNCGKQLLKVDYLLTRFKVIRNAINNHTFNSNPEINKSTYSQGPRYHYLRLVVILALAAGAYYFGSKGEFLLGYGGTCFLVVLIVVDYFITPIGIHIRNDYFVIVYTCGEEVIQFSDVEDILIADEFDKITRLPEIRIITRSAKRPITLKFGDTNVLYKALRKAVNI